MSEKRFPLLGISRLRMETDGEGVTTLVAARGCPLRCKYCLNPESWKQGTIFLSPQELYDRVRIDDLYFQATGGGVTFGGGEPLLYTDFISEFRSLCGEKWKLRAETSLCVPKENIVTAAACLDDLIVDIKDTDPDIYRMYTGQENEMVLDHLTWLIRHMGADHVMVRVPAIPGYNTEEHIRNSLQRLRAIGVTKTNCFSYRMADINS